MTEPANAKPAEDGAMPLPDQLRTPFRTELVARNIIAAAYMRSGKLVTHLVRDRRAMCGMARPKGEVSDMTIYAWEDQVCKKCLAAFGRGRRRKGPRT